MAKNRIVIVGGGFAGVKCAERLRQLLKRDEADVVLFNRENYLCFDPLLAELAAGALEPRHLAVPLRQLFSDVELRCEEVTAINLDSKFVEFVAETKGIERYPFDHLVIACGNDVNVEAIPGMKQHAFSLKTIEDALRLQTHLVEQLELAEVCEDEARKKWHTSFVVVGGGFSGAELAGEILDFVEASQRFYPQLPKHNFNVTLVHSHDQILPEVAPHLRDRALQEMKRHGVNFVLNQHAKHCTADGVMLQDGTFLSAGTVICTIGTAPAMLIEKLNVDKHKGRVLTDPDMRLKGQDTVWAIGDCAVNSNAYNGKVAPGTGQFAEREGIQAAENIVRVLRGKDTKPFSHKPLGTLCSIGGKRAVADMMGLRLAGFGAWFLWRSVYLFKLPTLAEKIRVGTEWGLQTFLPRELVFLKLFPKNRPASQQSNVRRAA